MGLTGDPTVSLTGSLPVAKILPYDHIYKTSFEGVYGITTRITGDVEEINVPGSRYRAVYASAPNDAGIRMAIIVGDLQTIATMSALVNPNDLVRTGPENRRRGDVDEASLPYIAERIEDRTATHLMPVLNLEGSREDFESFTWWTFAEPAYAYITRITRYNSHISVSGIDTKYGFTTSLNATATGELVPDYFQRIAAVSRAELIVNPAPSRSLGYSGIFLSNSLESSVKTMGRLIYAGSGDLEENPELVRSICQDVRVRIGRRVQAQWRD